MTPADRLASVPMPARIARLPRDRHGYPVPWFVAWIDGAPDFRIVGAGRVEEAMRFELCWLCGAPAGSYGSFVTGPMCAVNRVSAEPPSHTACAEYAARVCPFLTTPTMTRRERSVPEGTADPAGIMIRRNPGVALVWTSRNWRPFSADGGRLFHIGDPTNVAWFAEGREATREEVLASIETGLPLLRSVAKEDGPDALAQLDTMVARAMPYVPVAS